MHWPGDRETIRDTYDADGFVILKQFLPQDALAEVDRALRNYIEQKVPSLPAMDVFCEDRPTRQQIRMLPRMNEHDDFFDGLFRSGPLRDLAAHLLGTDAVPKDVAYFNKLPRIGEATPPHQDGWYFHLDPCEAITLWLSLDHVDEENACVRYLPGSHRSGMRHHERSRVLGFSQHITDYSEQERSREVPARVAPGDLIAHDALVVHRTDANRSARTRRAIGFVYFSARAAVDESARDRYQQQLAQELAAEGKV